MSIIGFGMKNLERSPEFCDDCATVSPAGEIIEHIKTLREKGATKKNWTMKTLARHWKTGMLHAHDDPRPKICTSYLLSKVLALLPNDVSHLPPD